MRPSPNAQIRASLAGSLFPTGIAQYRRRSRSSDKRGEGSTPSRFSKADCSSRMPPGMIRGLPHLRSSCTKRIKCVQLPSTTQDEVTNERSIQGPSEGTPGPTVSGWSDLYVDLVGSGFDESTFLEWTRSSQREGLTGMKRKNPVGTGKWSEGREGRSLDDSRRQSKAPYSESRPWLVVRWAMWRVLAPMKQPIKPAFQSPGVSSDPRGFRVGRCPIPPV